MIEALLNIIARVVATLIALVFVAGTVCWLVARSADSALLDPLTYELALAEHDVYLDLPDLVAAQSSRFRDSIADDIGGGDAGAAAIAALEPEDWKNLTRLLLPASETQRTTEAAIEAAFGWLNQKSAKAVVDLRPLKQNAAGRAGTQAIEILAGALPDCAEPGCPSPATVIANITPAALLEAVPDEIDLVADQAMFGPDQDQRQQLARARLFIAYAPFALGVLLVIAALFGARTRAGWLRWLGVPLLLAGLITLGAGLDGHATFDAWWIDLVAQEPRDGLAPEVMAKAHLVIGTVLDELARHLEFMAGSIALVGLALTLLSFFVPERRPHA